MLKRLAAVAALLAATPAVILLFGTPSAHAANIWTQPRPWGNAGSYIIITGRIVPGDEYKFANLRPPEPVYVRPYGPGGYIPAALAIGDIIAERGYSTLIQNNDGGCASACAVIALSGYAHHAIVQNSGILRFHSCWDPATNQDNLGCDANIAAHLMTWGYTRTQALALAYISPHEILTLGTKGLAARLGFTWQTIPSWPLGWGDSCKARFCIAVP